VAATLGQGYWAGNLKNKIEEKYASNRLQTKVYKMINPTTKSSIAPSSRI
jgi:hypothetical protein